jgi:hypothetical protein
LKLRSNPYQIFRHSKTPPGLYARKKWSHDQYNSGYKNDVEETVSLLLSGQSPDGSWEKSFMMTIRRLFGLHLTVREEIEPVRKGLDWLANQASGLFKRKSLRLLEEIHEKDFDGLPFTKGSSVLLITSATLFLSSVFGRGDDPGILKIYDWFQDEGSRGSGRWCGWSSYNNILRAFVVHPRYSTSVAVALAVNNLQHVQKNTGKWASVVPFYQTVNALAHLDSAQGDAQLGLAFKYLYETQRPDGTWSSAQPEWHSFLIIHALKNKGKL